MLSLVLLAGCGATPGRDAVGRFGVALSELSAETRAGFTAVEGIERRAQLENAALRYVQGQRADLSPRPVLTRRAADALNPTFAALDGYAAALVSITGDSGAQRLGAASSRFGAEVARALEGAGLAVPAPVVQRGTAALDQLGQLMAEEIVRLSLPAVIDRAHPDIEAIGALMKAIVGRPIAPGQVPEGLRGMLSVRRDTLTATRVTLLEELRQRSSGAERYEAFMRLAEAERTEPTDAAFVALEEAIGRMVTAHAALRSPEGAMAAVAAFEASARRLGAAWRQVQPLLR